MKKQASSRNEQPVFGMRSMIFCVISVSVVIRAAISSNQAIISVEDSSADVVKVKQNEDASYVTGISKQDQLVINKIHGNRDKRRIKLANGILPEFSAPIGNVTAVVGRDVRLICQVQNLGQYQVSENPNTETQDSRRERNWLPRLVAWLKEETATILSIDTNIIITNYRIFLIPDEEEKKWALHIKDVRESDRGSYQCQLNTSPMRSISGYLEVVVPPSIIQNQTSQVAEVDERSNVTVQCRASGHPKPTVSWRREDNIPMKLNGNHNNQPKNNMITHQTTSTSQTMAIATTDVADIDGRDMEQATAPLKPKLDEIRSERLTLYNVDRSMAGVYICTMSNGLPVPVSRRVPIHVKFQPKVTIHGNYHSIQVGDQLEVDCIIEAYPKPSVYWTKRSLSSPEVPSVVSTGYGQDYTNGLQTGHRFTNQHRHPFVGAEFNPLMRTLGPVQSLKLSNHHNNFDTNKQTKQIIASPIRQHHSLIGSTVHNRVINTDAYQITASDDQAESLNHGDNSDVRTRLNGSHVTATPSSIKSPISVKHSTIDAQTYKLTMTINRLKQTDFGEYTCIAINLNGQSDASIVIDLNSRKANLASLIHNSGSLMNQQTLAMNQTVGDHVDILAYQHQNPARRLSGHRIYDEKYLEAIKMRQNNGAISSGIYQNNLGRLQQKLLKPMKGNERNGANSEVDDKMTSFKIILIACVAISLCLSGPI